MAHPIHSMPPTHLRGYAHGLRNTAAMLGLTWAKTGADDDIPQLSLLIEATREAWEREATLIEGFAARLEAIEAEAETDAEEEEENPVVFWLAQDPDAGHFESAEDAVYTVPVLQPVEIASNGWPATRWAIREFISDDGDTQISWADTREEMMAYAADLTGAAASDELRQQAAGTYRETEPADLSAPETDAPVPKPEGASSDGEGEAAAVTAPLAIAPTPAEALPEGAAAAAVEALAAAPPAPSLSAREAAHALFMGGMKTSEIARQLKIPAGSVSAWASVHGWHKQRQAKKAAEPQAQPVITAGYLPPTKEEMAELREKFRVKEFGAKWLAEEYGIPPDKAAEILDQLRAEKKAKAA